LKYFLGNVIAYCHRTKRGRGSNWEGTSGGAEGDIFGEMLDEVEAKRDASKGPY